MPQRNTKRPEMTFTSGNVDDMPEQSLPDLIELLKTYRYSVGSEDSFQRSLEAVLLRHHIVFLREHQLGPEYGRIDFYLPDCKFGIELNVKVSSSQALRQ